MTNTHNVTDTHSTGKSVSGINVTASHRVSRVSARHYIARISCKLGKLNTRGLETLRLCLRCIASASDLAVVILGGTLAKSCDGEF
jgi:hypothetical protein